MKNTPLPEQFRTPKEDLAAYRESVTHYLTSMCLVKEMYSQGIIDKDDFATCEDLMAQKYGLSEKSIYRHPDPENPEKFKCSP